MGLKGRLSSLPLVDVLKLIDSKGHTGRLSLESDQRRAILYLSAGKLVFLSCLLDPVRVGLRLTWSGHLTRREYLSWKLAVSQKQKSTTVDFYSGETIPPEAWRRVFEVALQDEALELFAWQDGEFEFESCAVSLPPGFELNLPIESFLNQATEQANRWKQIKTLLPQEDLVPAIRDFSASESLVSEATPSESEWQVLAHVDGRRDPRALSSVCCLSYFDTCQSMVELARKGYVHWVPRPRDREPEGESPEPSRETNRGLLQRLTSKEKYAEASLPPSPVSILARFENRLLDRLDDESEEAYDSGQFLNAQWQSLWALHPLIDGFPLPSNRLESFRFEDKVSLWEDPEACEEVVLDCLCALQELVEATYREMQERLGEKKALQGYRKDYEQVLRSDLAADVTHELSWLTLAR